ATGWRPTYSTTVRARKAAQGASNPRLHPAVPDKFCWQNWWQSESKSAEKTENTIRAGSTRQALEKHLMRLEKQAVENRAAKAGAGSAAQWGDCGAAIEETRLTQAYWYCMRFRHGCGKHKRTCAKSTHSIDKAGDLERKGFPPIVNNMSVLFHSGRLQRLTRKIHARAVDDFSRTAAGCSIRCPDRSGLCH